MDFGLKGKTALVCAASKGLGKGCALALAGEGVNLVILARGKDALEATAEEIRKAYGVKVTTGAMDTDRLRSNITTTARTRNISEEQARVDRIAGIPAGRFGNIEEFGAICAFLCSQQASYVTGQNWLCDGGAYPGTF